MASNKKLSQPQLPQQAQQEIASAGVEEGAAAVRQQTGGRTAANRSGAASGRSSRTSRSHKKKKPSLATAGTNRREGGAAVMDPVIANMPVPAETRLSNYGGGGNTLRMPNFQFSAISWDGIESWERYETRVLSQCQEAFSGYARYTSAVASAIGLSNLVGLPGQIH